jgi:hypothetical protein
LPSTTAPGSKSSSSSDRSTHGLPEPIRRRIEQPRYPDLVFTSAGPHGRVAQWLDGKPAFDLWITDYGGCDPAALEAAQYTASRDGSKFQNLYDAWQTAPAVFAGYEAVFVLDDDIRIDAAGINRLFEVRREFDLTVLQPAYDPEGKISHAVTRARPTARLRFTNFVEVTCPLFRRDSLELFLRQYDPVLAGYGIDWWYCELLGAGRPDRLAVVDEVECLNPSDAAKGGREIDRLQGYLARKQAWEAVKQERGLIGEGAARTIRRLAAPFAIGRLLKDSHYFLKYYAKRIRGLGARAGRGVRRRVKRCVGDPHSGVA